MEQEGTNNNYLRIATQAVLNHQYPVALAILRPLSTKKGFSRQRRARYLMGITQTKLGLFNEAKFTYESLLSDFPEENVFWAKVVRNLCWLRLAFGDAEIQDTNIVAQLRRAAEIFDEHDAQEAHGEIVVQESILALGLDSYEDADSKIDWGTLFSGIKDPHTTPFSPDVVQASEVATIAQEAALVGAPS